MPLKFNFLEFNLGNKVVLTMMSFFRKVKYCVRERNLLRNSLSMLLRSRELIN